MPRLLIVAFLSVSLASCGPPLVWGGDEATKGRLLEIVPIGSRIKFLEAEAKFRNWRILNEDQRIFEKGSPHFFGGGCEHQGGVSMTVIVAEYGVLTTSVETAWLFDEEGKLGELCIRRTTDAP